jgi:hypothetical protein
MSTDPADEKIPLINDPVRLLDSVLDEAKILLDKKPYLSTHTTSDVVSLARAIIEQHVASQIAVMTAEIAVLNARLEQRFDEAFPTDASSLRRKQ